jgi:hypothetical protein
MKEKFFCIYIENNEVHVEKFEISDKDKEMESFHDFNEYRESIKSDMHKEYFFIKQCYQAVILTESEFIGLHSL